MTRLTAALILMAIPLYSASFKEAIVGSQHDLTVHGSGGVVSDETDACIFCHAPHNVISNLTPLWNQPLSPQDPLQSPNYTTYTSSTYTSGAQTPSAGSSKLCLSCHDGTVAVGLAISRDLNGIYGGLAPRDNLSTDLRTSHPISMKPVDDGSLVSSLFANPPSTKDPAVRLVSGKVECVTCHDPHVQGKDPVRPMFLVRSNANSTLCLACHDPSRAQPAFLSGWTTSSHATAGNNGPPYVSPYGTVAAFACSSCHVAHNPLSLTGYTPRNLLLGGDFGCSVCHDGNPDVSPPLLTIGSHTGDSFGGVHDAAEAIPVNAERHGECPDCHNPHAAIPQTGTALPPGIQAPLTSVSGYDTSGALKRASNEYQVCYKCHADSTNKAANTNGRTATRYPAARLPIGDPVPPPMPADQYNVRLKFMSTISHNVMGFSVVNTANTSLRPFMKNVDGSDNAGRPLASTTLLYCTDCHNNDQARSSNGTGADGPHGSIFSHLLQFNLFQDAPGSGTDPGSGSNYADLCNKCHNVATLIAQDTLNTLHRRHQGYGCTSCHDPHGVIGGNRNANRAMINFDTTIVLPTANFFGYFNLAATKGCYVVCHGHSHNPGTY